MSEKTATLEDVPSDRALKLNVEGAGNYRVAYDDTSWKLLLASLPGMNVADQVNLLSDAWAFVQAGREPFSFYTGLVGRLSPGTALAVREQIVNAFDSIDYLLAGSTGAGTIPALCAGSFATHSRYAHLPAKARRTNDNFVVARKPCPGTRLVGRRRGHQNVPAEFRELLEGPLELFRPICGRQPLRLPCATATRPPGRSCMSSV